MKDILGRTLIQGDMVWVSTRNSGCLKLAQYIKTEQLVKWGEPYWKAFLFITDRKKTFIMESTQPIDKRLLKASIEDITLWNQNV